MKLFSLILFLAFLLGTSAEQCGTQGGGAVCPNGLCCSKYGWCGTTSDYCGDGCQSQCTSGGSGGDVSSLISAPLFDQMLKYPNNPHCESNGFYTYNAFIAAARSFNGFGTTGDVTTRKREIAAFLAQTSLETTAKDDYKKTTYCTSKEWPCTPGKQYYGRGLIQLTHNYNYGQAGQAIGADLINNPELVATDPTISFKTAIWFWMTPQSSKPSNHDVIIGKWKLAADTSAGRVSNCGTLLECGDGSDSRVADKIGYYKRYCDILGVSYGNNLDCSGPRQLE
uniref:chitinase n=1 Tax=Fagus sylvatica TaxID=28930 RepID=A0A2N9G7K7_FAGSY